MPIFEIERDGKSYEVDAPDMQTAASAFNSMGPRSYSLSEVPGEALSNFPKSAQKVGGQIYEALSHPVETAKNIGKLGVGMVQEFIPGQQEYETTHADPFYQQLFNNYGSWDAAKRTLAEEPAQALMDVAAVASPMAGRVGQAGRALNLPYQTVRGVTNVAKRSVTPFPARPGFGEARQVLRNEGVSQTAGQVSGSRGLKYAESEIGGGRTTRLLDQQAEEFTRAASRRIGEDTPHLDPATLNNARNRIGNDFNVLGARNRIDTAQSGQLAADLGAAVNDYVQSVPIAAPGVQNIAQAIAQRGVNGINGRTYNSFRSRLSRLQRNTKDPQLITAYRDIRNALDDAMERSIVATGNQADIAAFQTARQQYRNYIVLQNAMSSGAGNTARGLLTPNKLETAAASGPNRSWYARGLSDFTELSKAGRVGMSPMPESGTAARLAIQSVPAAIGGAIGGGGAGLMGAAAGAIGGRMASGRALMSGPAQTYLGNQLIPRNIPGQEAVGRTASTAIAATPRVESLKHLENVISPNVLDHVKKSPTTRGLLNEWLKARYAGEGVEQATQALAEAIAAEVKRPDLVARIVAELSAAKNE